MIKKMIFAVLGVLAFLGVSAHGSKAAEDYKPNPYVYTVRPGNQMSYIARNFNVKLDALMEANKDKKCLKSKNLVWKG